MVTGEASPKRVEGGGGRGLLEQNQYIERIGHGSVLVCPTRSADLLMLNMLAKAGWFITRDFDGTATQDPGPTDWKFSATAVATGCRRPPRPPKMWAQSGL